MVQYLQANYYATTTRYATSAFLRLKMEEALNRRGVAPHVFERREEAQAFVSSTEDKKARKRISPAVASAAGDRARRSEPLHADAGPLRSGIRAECRPRPGSCG